MLLANSKIAPLLDRRVHAGQRSVAHWQKSVFSAIAKVPGVVKTGEKRDRRHVYRYDPQGAELLQAAAKRRRKTKGGKGEAAMPHLGAGQ
ncbi:hypothetical protein CHLRE_01g002234v5 [Chlamydomonas reinhardtii]|uniref:Uncharacterized protein n=1 Tax=Chlamydomonas reinhardtii TaxID=3055 RepID=A0A2K3E4S3_CHLRE|nr:uncharacterized protein CHLRE_01g002234v5 [Chlamydomonas reinhardtii]PNW87792.1 hypothetical protein CHLRE_01g002234v5 [Chlamydomonas reinhardtii]